MSERVKAMFSPAYVRAGHDYVCDGCQGEYPINKGDMIMKSKVLTHDGKFDALVLCSRCKFAIQSKVAHNGGKPVEIQKGDLRWSKLSNAFRKAWEHMCRTWAEMKKKHEDTEENWSTVIHVFIHESGCETFYDPEKYAKGVEEAAKMRRANRRSLVSMRKAHDELKAEIETVRKRNVNEAANILMLCNRLAEDRLALFQAQTDHEREEWRTKFIETINEIRNAADRIAEKTEKE